jgi:S-adenosylmethionine:tRNA ribosyltransferase-isomerase
MQTYRLSDFDYHLPSDLIAQQPAAQRSGSRLLVVPRGSDLLVDRMFTDLPENLRAGDLLVFNDSKVIPARLHAKKETGGLVEILVERLASSTQALVMLKASKKPSNESMLTLTRPGQPDFPVRLRGRDTQHDDRFVIDFQESVLSVLTRYGELPLPPYISHSPNQVDAQRYQTVYAQHPGSVAAPTAGLHFDEEMLKRLDALGVETARVTLHVGSGTFSPVRTEDLSQHVMHGEWCSLGPETADKILLAKAERRRVIAVGTTSLRTLESAASRPDLAGEWETQLFITPGYSFKLVDGLVTNFHLPKSTLLMLVSAFAGYDRIRSAYAHAIEQKYRFFSYGDAMFLERQR